jgi:hypothetical protein
LTMVGWRARIARGARERKGEGGERSAVEARGAEGNRRDPSGEVGWKRERKKM